MADDASLRFRDSDVGTVLSRDLLAEPLDGFTDSPEDETADRRRARGVLSGEGPGESSVSTCTIFEGTSVDVDDAAAFRAARARASTRSGNRVAPGDLVPLRRGEARGADGWTDEVRPDVTASSGDGDGGDVEGAVMSSGVAPWSIPSETHTNDEV